MPRPERSAPAGLEFREQPAVLVPQPKPAILARSSDPHRAGYDLEPLGLERHRVGRAGIGPTARPLGHCQAVGWDQLPAADSKGARTGVTPEADRHLSALEPHRAL